MAALAGMGAGGALGGMTGALIGFGMPKYEAKRYEGRMRKGGILLSVHADNSDRTSKGKQVLEETGAENIASAGETTGDFGNTDRPTDRDGRELRAGVQPAVEAAREPAGEVVVKG